MSSRANNQSSLERRVRRIAQRHNLSMLSPRLPEPRVKEHGGYMLRNDETGAYVFGDKPYHFSATLDEVEAWLDALSDTDDD